MTRDAFDDALANEPALSQAEDALLYAAAPITPPPALRDEIMNRIAAEPQVASITSRRRPTTTFFAAAAAVVMLAGAGVWWAGNVNNTPQKETTHASPSAPPASSATLSPGKARMDKIMTASDVRHGESNMMGAEIHVAVSDTMGEGCLTVDGMPSLDDGMTAQVWAVMENGDMESAGMLHETPAEDAWMLIPPGTMKVMVTQEPMAGSPSPGDDVLATVTLA
ncbi:anti-sigma factor [Corynebacterium sp.]|uniref:anti-sigma factor n=1 Tax=Corynebacterium sp. TaxID=1720 RepID=UPI0026DA7DDD|nr:anti-sigma factor [Corynebacterium sp.]MDO5077656.1 anti-sigma factor [Corynebacterium sp.]